LRRAKDKAGRAVRFQLSDHAVEPLDHLGRQRVGAGISAIEQEPRDPVGVAGEAEIVIGPARIRFGTEFEYAFAQHIHDLFGHGHTISISMAPPRPPPMHSVAMPRRVPSRFMALT